MKYVILDKNLARRDTYFGTRMQERQDWKCSEAAVPLVFYQQGKAGKNAFVIALQFVFNSALGSARNAADELHMYLVNVM